MKYAKRMGLGLVVAALAASGCVDPKPGAPKAEAKKAGVKADVAHAHGEGPNGGVIFDLGKYHAEFTVDPAKRECVVLFIAGDDKTAQPLPVDAAEFTLTTKPTKTKDGRDLPAMTISLKPVDAKDGKASKFVGTDPSLADAADFAGTVIGEIDGKPSSGEFKEEEHGGAKK